MFSYKSKHSYYFGDKVNFSIGIYPASARAAADTKRSMDAIKEELAAILVQRDHDLHCLQYVLTIRAR